MDVDPHHQHALCLDPDVKVGRLAGDREVATEPAPDDVLRGPLVDLLRLLVRHAREPDPDPVLLPNVLERAHHRGQRRLHVVGAAAEQPVALYARLELLRPAGNDVEMAVEDDARNLSLAWADLGHQHGSPLCS